MKVLYLHGYQGRPNKERISYLESLGIEVTAPQIDYDTEPNILIDLLEQDFDAVVGNSLGGYVGFYLSEWKRVPAILINPPMYMDLKIRVNQPPRETILRNQEGKHKVLARKHVIVGMDDDVVDPFKVIEWLFKNKPYSNLIAVDGMSHRYSQEQFVNAVDCIVAKWLV